MSQLKIHEELIFMALADNLRDLRHKHSLSQRDLADAIGVSHPRISEMEKGKANPTLSTLQNIADVFGVSVAHLVREKRKKLSKTA